MSALGCVIRFVAQPAVFFLLNRRAMSSAWPVLNSSPISQPARLFAGSPLSSSRHIVGASESVKCFLLVWQISHANTAAQALRLPARSIVLMLTGSTNG